MFIDDISVYNNLKKTRILKKKLKFQCNIKTGIKKSRTTHPIWSKFPPVKKRRKNRIYNRRTGTKWYPGLWQYFCIPFCRRGPDWFRDFPKGLLCRRWKPSDSSGGVRTTSSCSLSFFSAAISLAITQRTRLMIRQWPLFRFLLLPHLYGIEGKLQSKRYLSPPFGLLFSFIIRIDVVFDMSIN